MSFGTSRRGPRLAVVGSGPAGFYTASRILSRLDDAVVDMYESLPTPFGLTRYGVAPDHPEVKNCQDRFTEVGDSPRFHFIGNVPVGHGLPLSTLRAHYDAIILSYGASHDRRLHIPGEDSLSGIYSARAFVGWYNGLPEYSSLAPKLSEGEEALVIGNGNVALDVARTLLTDVDVLRKTDMTDYAVETLSKSRIRRVTVVGRRGPLQASFTIKEVRELMDLPSVSFEHVPSELLPTDPSNLPRAQKRMVQLLSRAPLPPPATPDAPKEWAMRFFLSPTAFHSSPSQPSQLSEVSFSRTGLAPTSSPLDPSAAVTPTSETLALPASVAFRSIGYRASALPGLSTDLGVAFDAQRGVIRNDGLGRATTASDELVPGVYTAGWAKRGPTGVIASTMADAFATADAVVADLSSWSSPSSPSSSSATGHTSTGLGWDAVKEEAERRGLWRVSWGEWKAIDAAERERGAARGKVREKFASVGEMLALLDR
ncbi:MAG: NADPH-adrenodoxin reductase [Thelocarpon impressellum]|nr:MAG: NADPH-adrenodoxin reductase [Thelocarpon impressellum]